MDVCPHCRADLHQPLGSYERRTNSTPGHKTTGYELIECLDCGEVIDGFTSH